MEKFIKLLANKLDNNNNDASLQAGVSFVEAIVVMLVKTIKEAASMEDAMLVFDVLDDIQLVVGQAVFGEAIEVSKPLRNFVHDFDRIDLLEVREWLYDEIKSGTYDLEGRGLTKLNP